MNIKLMKIWHEESQPDFELPVFLNRLSENDTKRYLFLESYCLVKAVSGGMHKGCDFFGMVAPGYKEKIRDCTRWGRDISGRGRARDGFSLPAFYDFARKQSDYDLISLTTHPQHAIFPFAEKYHPGITKATYEVFEKIGFQFNLSAINNRAFYFNYFVMKPKLLEKYVFGFLQPFIEAALKTPSIWENSGYSKAVPEKLKTQFGLEFWPMAPFITERLISIWADKEKLKFLSY